MYVCKYVYLRACVRVRFSPSASLGVSTCGVVFLFDPPLVVRGCLLGGVRFWLMVYGTTYFGGHRP